MVTDILFKDQIGC